MWVGGEGGRKTGSIDWNSSLEIDQGGLLGAGKEIGGLEEENGAGGGGDKNSRNQVVEIMVVKMVEIMVVKIKWWRSWQLG